MSAPALVIRLEIEARPKVYIDAMREGEADRLLDWLLENEALRDLLLRVDELCEARP
jgi:hypothetical protein